MPNRVDIPALKESFRQHTRDKILTRKDEVYFEILSSVYKDKREEIEKIEVDTSPS